MLFQNIFSQRATADLTAASLSDEYTADKPGFFLGVLLKASVNITETVTITHISEEGSASYDVILDSTALTADQNYKYVEAFPIPLMKGDKIKIACTNANTTGSVFSRIYMGR